MEIFAWLQCFGTYAAVLSTHEPTVVPEMMAYMGIIIWVGFPGLRRAALGPLRFCLPVAGSPIWQSEAVGSHRHSLYYELLLEGIRHEAA